MVWQQWVLITVFGITSISNVLLVGEPRKALTPGGAATSIIVGGLLIWLVLTI